MDFEKQVRTAGSVPAEPAGPLVECKLGGNYQFGHLNYFGERLGITAHRYMVSLTGTDDYVDKATGIRVIPSARFLTAFM